MTWLEVTQKSMTKAEKRTHLLVLSVISCAQKGTARTVQGSVIGLVSRILFNLTGCLIKPKIMLNVY